MSKLRIAFGIPAYGGLISAGHARMWLELGAILASSPERFELATMMFIDTQPVDRTRNLIVERALAAKADWLLMIDADTYVVDDENGAGFPLLRMISDADRAGAMLVGAPYVLRGDTEHLAVYRSISVDATDRMLGWPLGHKPIKVSEGPRQMYEAFAVGTGCVGLDLRDVAQHEMQFRFTDDLSEDLDMCRQIRNLGGKILVDGRITTAHMSRSMPLMSRVD